MYVSYVKRRTIYMMMLSYLPKTSSLLGQLLASRTVYHAILLPLQVLCLVCAWTMEQWLFGWMVTWLVLLVLSGLSLGYRYLVSRSYPYNQSMTQKNTHNEK